jgi:hypothetical protein
VFVVAHEAAPSLPIGTVALDSSGRAIALKAPALFPLRIAAGTIDGFLSAVLALALAVSLQGMMGPVFKLDGPFTLIASERTLSSDLPSLEIADGGQTSRTTVRSLVEKNYMGFVKQSYRRTAVEVKRDSGREVLVRDALLDGERKEISRPPLWWVAAALYLAMVILFEGVLFRGTSPGKLLMGLRVSVTNGERPGFIRAFVRNVSKIISILPALAGVLMALFSKRRQMLHDVITGSYVHDAQ